MRTVEAPPMVTPWRETVKVIRQKSAEAIVAQRPGQCPGHGEGPNIKTARSIHELA